MPGFAQVYFDGKTHFQIGDNTNLFDWTYVDNVVHAHLLAADAPAGVGGEVIHVTNGAPLPFWDFSRMIWSRMAAAGIEPIPRKRRIVLPRLVGMAIAILLEFVALFTRKEPIFTRFRVTYCCVDRYLNIDKARRLLGYKPLVSTEEGVQRMLDVSVLEHLSDGMLTGL
jgi:sterol-4alpha-carboxylate 3-dehydrogenase (decarboxylating)